MTLTRTQIADVLDALSAARDHLDGQIDVVDGDYGVPAPNRAMTICRQLDEARELMVRAFVSAWMDTFSDIPAEDRACEAIDRATDMAGA